MHIRKLGPKSIPDLGYHGKDLDEDNEDKDEVDEHEDEVDDGDEDEDVLMVRLEMDYSYIDWKIANK
ncbi:hypothetical protein CF336_g599 [Tilletia laevis]|uniref:Uncharacterized protein n=1 Tax=Tilletia caries TaxID=13290 RepID=A0A8T8TUM0_9BASI|nr:hypothetical protein CF336_g599 [Tilletia laevis]KAE8208603.1 hypothetical protein CF335_g295 [Tilletia laevis]KAE8265811.1 hypothetical protein A4X03_0g25 [Tilletia caries]